MIGVVDPYKQLKAHSEQFVMWTSSNDHVFGNSYWLKKLFTPKVFKSKVDAGSTYGMYILYDTRSYGKIENLARYFGMSLIYLVSPKQYPIAAEQPFRDNF